MVEDLSNAPAAVSELPLYITGVIYYLIRAKCLYHAAKYVIQDKKIENIHNYRVLAMCLNIVVLSVDTERPAALKNNHAP